MRIMGDSSAVTSSDTIYGVRKELVTSLFSLQSRRKEEKILNSKNIKMGEENQDLQLTCMQLENIIWFGQLQDISSHIIYIRYNGDVVLSQERRNPGQNSYSVIITTLSMHRHIDINMDVVRKEIKVDSTIGDTPANKIILTFSEAGDSLTRAYSILTAAYERRFSEPSSGSDPEDQGRRCH